MSLDFLLNDLSLSQGPLQDPTLHVVIPSSTVLLAMTLSCSFLVFHDLLSRTGQAFSCGKTLCLVCLLISHGQVGFGDLGKTSRD